MHSEPVFRGSERTTAIKMRLRETMAKKQQMYSQTSNYSKENRQSKSCNGSKRMERCRSNPKGGSMGGAKSTTPTYVNEQVTLSSCPDERQTAEMLSTQMEGIIISSSKVYFTASSAAHLVDSMHLSFLRYSGCRKNQIRLNPARVLQLEGWQMQPDTGRFYVSKGQRKARMVARALAVWLVCQAQKGLRGGQTCQSEIKLACRSSRKVHKSRLFCLDLYLQMV